MGASISSRASLEKKILELEISGARQVEDFKMSAASIIEGLKPSNMLRTVLKDVRQSPELRSTATKAAIGIGAGLIGKKLFLGNSKNIFKKAAGSAVQLLITSFVIKRIPEMRRKNHTIE